MLHTPNQNPGSSRYCGPTEQSDRISLEGRANNGSPRQDFADKICELGDNDFVTEARNYIWLSAYADNNPRSDYHWMADACYDEAARRGKPELYQRAWTKASA